MEHPSDSRLPLRLPLWWHLSDLGGPARQSRGLWGDVRAAAAQRGGQFVHSDRLAEVVVHPRGQTGLSIRLPGSRRRRDHIEVPAGFALAFPDGLDDLEAVEVGQMYIEEEHIKGR